jgi:hypothetical protein
MGTVNSGPIPGANMTSDTKNYPWRQPPKYTDVNSAMDFLAGKITKFKVANGLLTMAELQIPVYQISQIVLMQGVAEGMWTVDFALLLAGPLARMIELICIGFDVEYDLGIEDDENDFNTGSYFHKHLDLSTPAGGFSLVNQEDPDPNAQTPSDSGEQSGDTGQGTEQTGQEQDLMTGGFMAMSGQPNPADRGAKK